MENYREYLNEIDHKCLDEDLHFYDLRSLYESTVPNLSPEDKQELKKVLDSTNDPEIIAAALTAKATKDKNESLDEDSDDIESIKTFEVFLDSGNGTQKRFALFDDEMDAEDFCNRYDWHWTDENGFDWHLDYREIEPISRIIDNESLKEEYSYNPEDEYQELFYKKLIVTDDDSDRGYTVPIYGYEFKVYTDNIMDDLYELSSKDDSDEASSYYASLSDLDWRERDAKIDEYLKANFNRLFEKYEEQLLDKYEYDAREQAEDDYNNGLIESLNEEFADTNDIKIIVKDVIDNFKEITGIDINAVYNPIKGSDSPIFDQDTIDKTYPLIDDYLSDKYDLDGREREELLYALDDELTSRMSLYNESLNEKLVDAPQEVIDKLVEILKNHHFILDDSVGHENPSKSLIFGDVHIQVIDPDSYIDDKEDVTAQIKEYVTPALIREIKELETESNCPITWNFGPNEENKVTGGLDIMKQYVEESLNEASYGGAYDIEDDMYFTKDDLNEFCDILIDKLNDKFGYSFDIYDAGFDSPTQLYIEVIDETHSLDVPTIYKSFVVDMRKIRKPSDLQKYIPAVFDYFVNRFEKEYNEQTFDESLNEDIDDEEYESEFEEGRDGCFYKEIAHKMVYDSDGFTTDYTLYMKAEPTDDRFEVSYVTVFGDNELYRPDDGDYDYETDDLDNAFEWFNSYNGFEDDLKESLKESHNDDNEWDDVWYIVYELDEDGDELDSIKRFKDEQDAINFAKKQNINTHVVFVPAYDPDDNPDSIDYLRYTYGYDPFEIIWQSDKEIETDEDDDIDGSASDMSTHAVCSGSGLRGNKTVTTVVIEEGTEQIDPWAFYNCKSLKSITLPNSITDIGGGAFTYCESLQSIVIPNSVTRIGDWAFHNCHSLQSITIPNSVTDIGVDEFEDCDSLKLLITDKGSYAEQYFSENYPDVNIKYLNTNESLNEAKFGPYKYRYEVHWISPKGNDILLGANNDFEAVEEIAVNQIEKLLENPWEDIKDKYRTIESLYVYDSEKDDADVMGISLEDYIDGILSELDSRIRTNSLDEDTVKQNGKWVNKGKEGTHGTFKTKKQADAQRKAMFAQGYKESLDNNYSWAEKKLFDLVQTANSDYTLDDIQLYITPKGNINIRTKDDKDIMTVNRFSDDVIDELRLQGYFDFYDSLDLDESLSNDYPDKYDELVNKVFNNIKSILHDEKYKKDLSHEDLEYLGKLISKKYFTEGLQDIHNDFEAARQNWKSLGLDVSFDDALEKYNDKYGEERFYAKPVYDEDAWNQMVHMFSESLLENKRNGLRDALIDCVDYFIMFEMDFPKDEFLADSWEDLKDGIQMGIDPEFEIAEGVREYLKPIVTFNKKYIKDVAAEGVFRDEIEMYNRLVKEMNRYLVDNGYEGNITESLNIREKQVYINAVNEAEDLEDLEDIVHEIFFYDKPLFVQLRHFPKDKSFEEIRDHMIDVLNSDLDETLNEALWNEYRIDFIDTENNHKYSEEYQAWDCKEAIQLFRADYPQSEGYKFIKIYKLTDEGYEEIRSLDESLNEKLIPDNAKILDSGYCDKDEWNKIKKEQIEKYSKDYSNVKCELNKSDTPGLRMWLTYYIPVDESLKLKEDYQHQDDTWGEPYTFKEVEADLTSLTNNWQDKEGTLRCHWEQEKEYGKQILEKHYETVEVSDGRTGKGEDMSWVLSYSKPIEQSK